MESTPNDTNSLELVSEKKLILPTAEISVEKEVFTDQLTGKFILVKGGTFNMGCTSEQQDCNDDEKPVHPVTLGDYYIAETEVTQAQWKAVMGDNPSVFEGCDDCPVEKVSWNDVQEFITRLNARAGSPRYRLPTEAEWEYAARGGANSRGYQYAGSNDINEVAWYDDNSGSKTHPVKGKKPNELGVYDMSGNVCGMVFRLVW
jgi:formylglycine-generating enzyme required for sulfatase activity